jgi:type IV pilus assembly protein PilW
MRAKVKINSVFKIERIMKAFSKKRGAFQGQAGFSMIELMISILVGLLVLAAVLKIFTNSMEGVHLQNGFSRVQESGRLATELMIRDIRGADYWGCGGDIGEITNHLNTADLVNYDASILPTAGAGIGGANNVTSLTIAGIAVKDTTDTLTLRGAGSLSDVKIIAPYMNVNAATIHVYTASLIAKGTILLISDCKEADLFVNTNDTAISNGNNTRNIGHSTGNIPGLDNAIKNLSHTYAADAQILIPFTKVFFIGVNTSGTHSLYRADNGVANELVRGVTDLQLLFGEDTSGNGSANTFTATPADMDNVISIRASITAESGLSSSGTPIVRTYHTTANIRNRTLQ